MKRPVFTTLAIMFAFSGILSFSACFFSAFSRYECVWATKHRAWIGLSTGGKLYLLTCSGQCADTNSGVNNMGMISTYNDLEDFLYDDYGLSPQQFSSDYWGLQFLQYSSPMLDSTLLRIPYWMIFVPSVFLPGIWVVFYFRQTRLLALRKRDGLCLNCGYDLRASTDRCPKCGTPFNVPPLTGGGRGG